MHGAKYGSRSMMRLAMVVGIVAAFGMRGAAFAAPGGGAAQAPTTKSAAATQHTLQTYWTLLDDGGSPVAAFADDVVLTLGDTGQAVTGSAAVSSALHNLYHGAFAGRLTIDTLIIGSGWAATSGEFVGTQIGPYAGVAATGNSVAVPYTASYTLIDGMITTIRLDFAQQDILSQLANPASPLFTTPIYPGRPY